MKELLPEDIAIIIESLKYSKKAIEDYQNHPSYEFKQKKLRRLEAVMEKIKLIEAKQ